MLKALYQLTKPGIIYGNAITVLAGFFLASRWHIHPKLLLAMLVGLSLIIASGCVFNNFLDVEIDSKMERTRSRALVTGKIDGRVALIFGALLGGAGVCLLKYHVNMLALYVALTGWVVYVLVYTLIKPHTVHATIVGSIAGAVPPVVGYTAVTNRLDVTAILLFLMLVLWQMPHFYAIAIYRLQDYTAAGIPVLPAKFGPFFTKVNILLYILGFILVCSLFTALRVTGYVFLGAALLLGFAWFYRGVKGLGMSDDRVWARSMFLFSLIVLTSLSVVLMGNVFLP